MNSAVPIQTFDLSSLFQFVTQLQKIGNAATDLEHAAGKMMSFLRKNLSTEEGSRDSALVLARVFRTMKAAQLPFHLRPLAEQIGVSNPQTRCLVLLGTDGEQAEWTRPESSENHRLIPFDSPERLARAPMLSALLHQMGLEAASVTSTGPILAQRSDPELGSFFVPHAVGSPHIPDQSNFIVPYGIQSVMGFGWLLVGGEAYMVVLFSKVALEESTAARLKQLASSIALALMPFERSYMVKVATN